MTNSHRIRRMSVDAARRSDGKRGLILVASVLFFVVLTALGVFLAFIDERLGSRLILLSIAVASAALTLGLALSASTARRGFVRFAASGTLRFVPPRRLAVAAWVIAAAFLLPGATVLGVVLLKFPVSSIRGIIWGPVVLAVVAFVEVGRLAAGRRIPAGLTLDETGIRGVRGAKRIDLRWEEIGSVSPVGTHGMKLMVSSTGRMPATIGAPHLGSDAACVAAVLTYFRDHPDHRPALNEPAIALNTVEHALRAG